MVLRYFFVSLIVKLVLVAGQPQPMHYVLKGREAILTPSLTKIPDVILWKHNGDKVIEFDSAQESVYRDYKGRVTLAWDTAELAISDVKYEDSGEYELDALIRDRLHRTQYMLKVLDKVSKPVITCQMNDESSSNKTSGLRATLTCSSESNTPEALTYKWNLDGKHQLGQALTIPLGNDHDEIEYSCTATNPLHAETTIYLAKDCHTVRTTEALNVVVPIVIALLILIAFGAMFFIFRHQLKKMCCTKGENKDLEKQIKSAMRNADEAERKPLMNLHRQETFPSQQRLPQTDNVANVRETPQKQEIRRDLDVLQVAGNVTKNKENFGKAGQTEVLLDTQTESLSESTPPRSAPPVSPVLRSGSGELNDNGQNDLGKESSTEPQKDLSKINPDQNKAMPSDLQKSSANSELPGDRSSTENGTSLTATSIMPNSGPSETGSNGQIDLNGESADNAQERDKAGDTSSTESDDEYEDAPESESPSPTSPQCTEPSTDQDSELQPGEDQSEEQKKSEEQPDVDHSDDNKKSTDDAGDSGSTELRGGSSKMSSKKSEVNQDSQSKPKKDESKGQADSEEKPDMNHSGDNPQKPESSTAPERTGQDLESKTNKDKNKNQEDTNENSNIDPTLEEGLQTGQTKDDSISSGLKEPVKTDHSDTSLKMEQTDQQPTTPSAQSQKQETTKDIEDLKSAAKVKENIPKFKKGKESNTEHYDKTASQPTSGSVKKTKDKTEEGVQSEVPPDTQTESQPKSTPPSSVPHAEQDISSQLVKDAGNNQKDSDNQTNKDSTEDNDPNKDLSSINPAKTGQPDVKTTPTDSVPGEESNTEHYDQTACQPTSESVKKTKDKTEEESQTESTPQSSVSHVDQDVSSGPGKKVEGKDQNVSDKKTNKNSEETRCEDNIC